VADTSVGRRLLFGAAAGLLPAVLCWRVAARALRTGRHRSRVILALPLIALLQTIWSFGECVGYLTGRTGGAA